MAQAKAADAEIAAGKYRGPLHGIPWGAKDLLAVKGYPTTWGAGGSSTRPLMKTRPWCSGWMRPARCWWPSSRWARWPWATSGSAGARAIHGIPSRDRADRRRARPARWRRDAWALPLARRRWAPSRRRRTRCGATGLRPTFGFVPRTGAMALSWTMDKLGPICRSVEDCAAGAARRSMDRMARTFRVSRTVSLGPGFRLAHAARRLSEKRVRSSRSRMQLTRPRPTKRPKRRRSAKTRTSERQARASAAITTAATIWPRSTSCARWA